jgi:hypothetical protein
MMVTPSRRTVLSILISIGIFGIGTPSDAAPAPCSLLTAAEVEQVVGKLAGDPKAD